MDLGGPGDSIYLSLYGTGFRGASSVSATVGEMTVPVSAFGPVSEYEGEDQVNIGPLPSSLAGHGDINILLTFDGKLANTVTGNIR